MKEALFPDPTLYPPLDPFNPDGDIWSNPAPYRVPQGPMAPPRPVERPQSVPPIRQPDVAKKHIPKTGK